MMIIKILICQGKINYSANSIRDMSRKDLEAVHQMLLKRNAFGRTRRSKPLHNLAPSNHALASK